uniref:Protein kinase domain-containing protein n=1 Tax=Acrobeloides nanus TaxID=290746 RepID=A0A914E3E1_9BILA
MALSPLRISSADRSLFDTLLAPVPTTEDSTENGYGKNREDQVRVFIKQLLTALQYMHHRNIAHLDLRPEVILLQDDHLRLADFGQSRHLLRGKASGDIKGSPEFVPPEVVLGKTVTLAADMWSSGVLAYVLLSGSSPFLGDNDNETLNNVVHGEYTLDIPDLSDVSADARDFLIKLLVVDQFKRLTVDEALNHPWLADPALKDAKLATDCLREFKYRHKWLERRVFVQQTPSAELTQFIEAPLPTIAEVNRINGYQQGQAEPRSIYDYLKIKDTPQVHTYGSKQIDPRKAAQLRQALLQGRTQNGDIPSPLGAPFDQLPPNVRLPPGVHPQDLYGPPFNGHPLDPRLQRFAPFDQMGPLPVGKNGPHGEQDKRRLQPQEKGETPLSQNGHVRSSKRQSQIPDYTALAPQEDSLEDIVPVPTRLLRGEHREIEEEIANRILSDISEENSVAGSLASIDDFEPILPKTPRDVSRLDQLVDLLYSQYPLIGPYAQLTLTLIAVANANRVRE